MIFCANKFFCSQQLGLPWMLQTCFADPGSSVFPYATACTDLPCRSLNDCERCLSIYIDTPSHLPAPFAELACLSCSRWCMIEEGQTEGQCMLKVNSVDQDAVNNSLMLLVGSFFFILFVIRASRWNLTPMLGWVMVVAYFAWAGWQIWADRFAGNHGAVEAVC